MTVGAERLEITLEIAGTCGVAGAGDAAGVSGTTGASEHSSAYSDPERKAQ